MAFMFPTVMLVLNVSSVAAIWLGADRIAAGDMQIGSLIVFLSYLIQILMSVMMATFVGVLMPAGRGERRADRRGARHAESSVVPPDRPGHRARPAPSSLELRDVEFAYPGADFPVLCDISFRAVAGETTAIIGSTGAGKTTLLNLVPRLFDATAGAVLVDGVTCATSTPSCSGAASASCRRSRTCSRAPSRATCATATRTRPTRTLWQALEIAQAAQLRRGDAGRARRADRAGRHQRLGRPAAAPGDRPGARPPARIYLFDDSFSALDLATDARLRAALAPEVADAVTVIVAQRVSTIINADQILVIEDGRQVGLGTHASCSRPAPPTPRSSSRS